MYQSRRPRHRRSVGKGSKEGAGAKRGRRRKGFLVCKDDHVFAFVYPPEQELVALKALASCPVLEPADVLALACYLGRNPHELGLDKPS